ncbi:hypothetical protein TBK1r_62430 [Stieleria magnilauensis]|uniref:Uncharacterized protein n=1 Tax=Stieleria magnilauensis TaxID=2527963 RepID=A0ABX5XYX1_9BACT|nr:hypothetical protein TBK1r_62430 [Planctomycetes bacterium TBK1r]
MIFRRAGWFPQFDPAPQGNIRPKLHEADPVRSWYRYRFDNSGHVRQILVPYFWKTAAKQFPELAPGNATSCTKKSVQLLAVNLTSALKQTWFDTAGDATEGTNVFGLALEVFGSSATWMRINHNAVMAEGVALIQSEIGRFALCLVCNLRTIAKEAICSSGRRSSNKP